MTETSDMKKRNRTIKFSELHMMWDEDREQVEMIIVFDCLPTEGNHLKQFYPIFSFSFCLNSTFCCDIIETEGEEHYARNKTLENERYVRN